MPPSWPSPPIGWPTVPTALPRPGLRKRPLECCAKPANLKKSTPLASGPSATWAKIRNRNVRCLFTVTYMHLDGQLPLFNHRALNAVVLWALASTGPSERQAPCHSPFFHNFFHCLV